MNRWKSLLVMWIVVKTLRILSILLFPELQPDGKRLVGTEEVKDFLLQATAVVFHCLKRAVGLGDGSAYAVALWTVGVHIGPSQSDST